MKTIAILLSISNKMHLNSVLVVVLSDLSNFDDSTSGFGHISYSIDVISILFTIVCVLAILLLPKRSQLTNEVRDHIKAYIEKKIWQQQSSPNKSNNQDGEIRQVKMALEEIRRSIALNQASVPVPTHTNPPVNLETEHPVLVGSKTEISEVYYLPTPNRDGSFDVSSVSSSYREGTSIYKITRISENRANFEIENKETAIKLAIAYPDLRIEPCCQPLNAHNSSAGKIETVRLGLAELREDKWKVTEKAQIRYEN